MCLFKAQLEEEESKLNDAQTLLSRTDNELQRLRLKCRCDRVEFVSVELLEQAKRRHALKISEALEDVRRLRLKNEDLEKSKQKFKMELDKEATENEELKANILYLGDSLNRL